MTREQSTLLAALDICNVLRVYLVCVVGLP